MFKRLNFDEPVVALLTEYNKNTTILARRDEIKTLIEDRKKLMNYLTESPNEKGIVESVKFNYGPKKMTVSANVVDIDKVKNFNVEDYVKRGGSYLEAFKAKGTGLFEESGQIIKKKLDKAEILQLMKTAKTAKGPAKLKALGALVTMLGAGAVYELGFSPTELQAAEAQAVETGVVDKAKSWPVEHPWLTGGAATGAAATTKKGRSILGKAFRTLGTPLAGPLWATYTAGENLKSGKSLTESVVDPWVGMELMFPSMFKENVAKITKSPTLQKVLSLGKFGTRFMPGIGTAITLGSVGRDSARAMDKESKRIDAIEDPETHALELEKFVRNIKGY